MKGLVTVADVRLMKWYNVWWMGVLCRWWQVALGFGGSYRESECDA